MEKNNLYLQEHAITLIDLASLLFGGIMLFPH